MARPSFEKVRGDRATYGGAIRIEALAAVAGSVANSIPGTAPQRSGGRRAIGFRPGSGAGGEIRCRWRHSRYASSRSWAWCLLLQNDGKGLHVVTPLTEGKDAVKWPIAKDFAHLICAQMAQDSPSRYLDTMSKSQRADFFGLSATACPRRWRYFRRERVRGPACRCRLHGSEQERLLPNRLR